MAIGLLPPDLHRAGAGRLRSAERSPTASEPEPSGSAAEPGRRGEPTSGGTLVFAGARTAASLDPALTSDAESFRILGQIYEPLVALAPGSTDDLVGALAQDWTGEPTATEYVFTLREGVTFEDGTPLNAGRSRPTSTGGRACPSSCRRMPTTTAH